MVEVLHLSKFSQKTISESINISKMKDDYVSIDHIILGMIATNDIASQLLKDNGFNTKDVNKILELGKGNKVTSSHQEETYNSLNKFAINLNEKAESGKLDPVIGRR